MAAFSDPLLLMVVLTLRSPANAFISSLRMEPIENNGAMRKELIVLGDDHQKWSDIFARFQTLKCFANQINSIFGASFLFLILQTIVHYSISFHRLLSQEYKLLQTRINVFLFFGNTMTVLVLAADISQKVRKKVRSKLVMGLLVNLGNTEQLFLHLFC